MVPSNIIIVQSHYNRSIGSKIQTACAPFHEPRALLLRNKRGTKINISNKASEDYQNSG
jgi:hypothetical protein